MKLHYYPETDSLYIELKSAPGAETREIAEWPAVDFDAKVRSRRPRHQPTVENISTSPSSRPLYFPHASVAAE